MADRASVNAAEIEVVRAIEQRTVDGPVSMLNLNTCNAAAQYPHGEPSNDELSVLEALPMQVGGTMPWRTRVQGHVVGNQNSDEARGIWYRPIRPSWT